VDVSLLAFGIIGLLAYLMVVGNPSARPPRAFGPDSPKNDSVILDFVKRGPKPRIVLKTEVEDLRRFWRPQDLMKTVEKFSKKF
jgi:hypothetical protein